jgi:hypothetical protein
MQGWVIFFLKIGTTTDPLSEFWSFAAFLIRYLSNFIFTSIYLVISVLKHDYAQDGGRGRTSMDLSHTPSTSKKVS